MPDISKSHEILSWIVTGAGMVFWATFLHGVLEQARNNFSNPISKLSPLKMVLLSAVAFFVPVILAQVVLNVAPPEFYTAIDPWLRLLTLAFLAYSGQQLLHWNTH